MLALEASNDLEEKTFEGVRHDLVVQPTANSPRQYTPVGAYTGTEIASKIGLLPIMRAGIGMTEPLLRLWPNARVYHLGLFRFVSLF